MIQDVVGTITGGSSSTSPSPSATASPTSGVTPSVTPSASTSASPGTSLSPSPLASPSPSVSPGLADAPQLGHKESGKTVLLTVRVDPRYQGDTVYFFVRSGQTGVVRSLGRGTVNGGGYAFRRFDGKDGQILRVYGKILGASNIVTPYSHDAAFKLT